MSTEHGHRFDELFGASRARSFDPAGGVDAERLLDELLVSELARARMVGTLLRYATEPNDVALPAAAKHSKTPEVSDSDRSTLRSRLHAQLRRSPVEDRNELHALIAGRVRVHFGFRCAGWTTRFIEGALGPLGNEGAKVLREEYSARDGARRRTKPVQDIKDACDEALWAEMFAYAAEHEHRFAAGSRQQAHDELCGVYEAKLRARLGLPGKEH